MAIGGHHSPVMQKDEWLTPPFILEALGPFDLDPCAPERPPWKTAARSFSRRDDGLAQEWTGRVWMNPPYGKHTGTWLSRLAEHGDGIALVFARTETAMFFDQAWGEADAMLFIRGRLHFHHVDGTRASANSGAPSVLLAYGDRNVEALLESGIPGALVDLRKDGFRLIGGSLPKEDDILGF